jgi:hypothetical protein
MHHGKRLYITTHEVWAGGALDINGAPISYTAKFRNPVTYDPVTDTHTPESIEEKVIPVRYVDLFHPGIGSHWINLDGTHLLISAAFHDEDHMETWHAHPHVARLPHPIYESGVTLHQTLTEDAHSAKQFKQHHLDALMSHDFMKIQRHHTVHDVAKAARKFHPLVKVSNFI